MTFKEFHILNENTSDFAQKIEEFLDGKDINNFFKYNEENKIVFADNISKEDKDEIYKIMEDTGYKSTYEGRNENTFSQKSLGKSVKKLIKGNPYPNSSFDLLTPFLKDPKSPNENSSHFQALML